jgi:thiosulfate/3-mercaptopyruvate sulfurtransferase
MNEVPIDKRGYTHPEVLVSTEWVAQRLGDAEGADLRIVESNEDPLVYPSGHIPGAVEIDWTRDLNDPLKRDYIGAEAFAALMTRLGITPRTTVVFYGDRNNWWAAYAYWVFQLFGHDQARLMDGGRLKWQQEGRPLVQQTPAPAAADYPVPARDDSVVRAFQVEVLAHVEAGRKLVDVRSPEEYSGERLHMPDFPNEGALRGGHIPGAASIPWARAVNSDGTFKSAAELRAIYQEEKALPRDEEVIVYCRIGERSSHSWFVLTHLLGFEKVRNYDGSWTEWGNSVGVPIER